MLPTFLISDSHFLKTSCQKLILQRCQLAYRESLFAPRKFDLEIEQVGLYLLLEFDPGQFDPLCLETDNPLEMGSFVLQKLMELSKLF